MMKEPPERRLRFSLPYYLLSLILALGSSVSGTEIYEEGGILPSNIALNSSEVFKDVKCASNSTRFVNTNFTLIYTLSNESLHFDLKTIDGNSMFQQVGESKQKVEKLFLLGTSFINSAITNVKGKDAITLTGGANHTTRAEFDVKDKKVVVELRDVEGDNVCATVVYGNLTGFGLGLDPGVDPNGKDLLGLAPLHWAAMFGDVSVLRRLLDMGADVNVEWTAEIATPLHFAVVRGDKAVVRFLVDAGADVNAEDVEGMTVIDAAIYSNQSEVVRQLLELGANLTTDERSGRTALHIAAERGNTAIIDTLLERGLDVNARDLEGRAPLNVAIEYRHPAAVHRLVHCGASLNTTELRKLYGERVLASLLPANITIVE